MRPLIQRLESSIRQQGSDDFEVAYDIEDELGTRLIADIGEAISSALAMVIVENDFRELDDVIDDATNATTIKRRLTNYFETFRTSDFFQELHELRSTLKLRENFETYLYVGTLQFNRISYPLFYIPVQIDLQERIFRITADPQIYINKKALEFAAQETAREVERAIPISIKDRIIYLDEGQNFLLVMQSLLDQWCADLALKPALDLTNVIDQKAQRSQIAVTNAIHFSAFDKADESLLNDYEELLTKLASGAEVAIDFQNIIDAFLTRDPINFNIDIDQEWDNTPIEGRLVFQSPVPLNEEQRKILSALRHKDTRFLSIEGPPGTGKSHTISAIVFEAILNGKNVLVLSDKTEALDVVEDKLNQILNSVRVGDDFQNPILRLGRTGNSYARILSNQAVEAIRASHKSSNSAQPQLIAQIEQGELRLTTAIRKTIEQGAQIKMAAVHDIHEHESRLERFLPKPSELVTDQIILDALFSVWEIGAFLRTKNFAVLKILRTVYQRATLSDLERFIRLQKLFEKLEPIQLSDLEAMRFFSAFKKADLNKLHSFIAQYQAARLPVFGYLFSGKKVRALDTQLGAELSPVTALNAHRKVEQLELAYAALAKASTAFSRTGIADDGIDLAFQQTIDGLPPSTGASELVDHISRIQQALTLRPDLKSLINLDPDAVADWAEENPNGDVKILHDTIQYALRYRELQETFGAIPEFDYAGDANKLESLHAQRLAHALDQQILYFADNHRNLARSIRDVIRKKQQFPKADFATMLKAFPCMIAGIRDYAEYIPLEKGLFDIVVIDEASQVSIAQALPAFIRAKKLVVLGDRKQFSNVKTANASIEINNQYANAIIDGYRRERALDVSTLNRLKLFNIKTSVLDFVERIANTQAMLRKHFRGYPELISFSSKTFYNSQLQAVKIRGLPIDDVIRFTEVQHDGRVEIRKNINSPEWEMILDELRRLASFDEPPSVGIITPFNEQQSFIVQKMTGLSDGDYLQDKLRLKVMTFDSCQGEERDIIIYSLVANQREDKLAYIFPKSLDEADEVDHALRLQRLNVGFSRAKERIHFFHSMPLDKYKGAISKAINHYLTQLEFGRKRPMGSDTDPKSPMEKEVLTWLYQTHFVQMLGEHIEIDAQFELGAYLRQLDPGYRHPEYRVDFLLKIRSGTNKGVISIIIEYDGFKEHFTNLDKVDAYNHEDYYRPEDVERQKILEGYGYRFLRINRFNLGRDPVKTLDARLTKLAGDALQDTRPHEIINQVKETTSDLISGTKKVCKTCGQVRDIADFKDPELQHRTGRKCLHCKKAEAAEKAQQQTARATRKRTNTTDKGHRW